MRVAADDVFEARICCRYRVETEESGRRLGKTVDKA
jgi:hypothetical protein